MDPGDHRLGDAGEGQHHRAALVEQRLGVLIGGILAQLAQVMSGAERLARTGEDNDADAGVALDGPECIFECVEKIDR